MVEVATRADVEKLAQSVNELITAVHALKRAPRKPKTPGDAKTKTAKEGGGVKKPRKPKAVVAADGEAKPKKPRKKKAAVAAPIPTPSEADD